MKKHLSQFFSTACDAILPPAPSLGSDYATRIALAALLWAFELRGRPIGTECHQHDAKPHTGYSVERRLTDIVPVRAHPSLHPRIRSALGSAWLPQLSKLPYPTKNNAS